MLDHGSGYGPVFAMAGSFHVVAFFIILLMIPVVGPFMDKPPLRLEAAR